MGKTITLTRRELFWQTIQNTFDETDYKRLLEWLGSFDSMTSSWGRTYVQEYKVLSQYSWDEVVAFVKGEAETKEPDIVYLNEDGSVWYTSPISEVIMEYIREENYDATDEDYADDYYEDVLYGE